MKTKRKTKSRSKNALVSKNMLFADLLQKYPESYEFLLKKNLHCIGCGMAAYETLEQGAIMHGMNPDKLVSELNKHLGKNNKK